MEDKDLLQNPPLGSEGDDSIFSSSGFKKQKVGSERDETAQVIGDSGGHVPKQVHQFYFVKLCPTEPDLVSRIRKAERVIEETNVDHVQISEKIKEKMSERDHLNYTLKYSSYYYSGFSCSKTTQWSILNDLYLALDELCFAKNGPGRLSNQSCFKGLDNHKLNFMMLHGSKNLAEEKQILKEMNTSQRRDAAPFSSLDQLRYSINRNFYTNYCQKLLAEIKQFQFLRERAAGNAAVKGKMGNYVSLKKAIKDQIKILCDETLEHRRERMASRTKFKHTENKIEAINKSICSLQKKLTEKNQKKAKTYQSILELKKEYDGEITHYDQYRSLMNHVHQLAEMKDIEALDELSRSEGRKFMLEWNNNKAFREDYEKRVLQSLYRRELSRDGRMESLK